MENNTKILIGVGVVLVAYIIFKPKKETGDTIVASITGDNYSDEDLCFLTDFFANGTVIEDTDPRYEIIKEKFSKKSLQNLFGKNNDPKLAEKFLEDIKSKVAENRILNSQLAKVTPQQYMDCLKNSKITQEQKDLFKNGISYSIVKDVIKKMIPSYPTSQENAMNQKVCMSIQGVLRDAANTIKSCNPSLMPNSAK